MKIILMRHGKPLLPRSGWIAPSEMGRWIAVYDGAKASPEAIPECARNLAGSASFVVTSTSPRAISSIALLGRHPHTIDEIYCEAELPCPGWNIPRLSPIVWAPIFRLLWLLGFSGSVESLGSLRSRARQATEKLIGLAAEHDSVLLAGHGIMNRLIARELLELGWSGPRSPGTRYWSAGTYSN